MPAMDHSQMDHSGHMGHGGGDGMDDMCSMSVRIRPPSRRIFPMAAS